MHSDSDSFISGLSHEGLIRVSGADSISFLQGQLSTDVEKITPSSSQFSSWSNAKGRVVTLFRVFRRGDDIYLSLPAGLLKTVMKKLSLYVLRSKVTLSDGSVLGRLGLVGTQAPERLRNAGISAPTEVNQVADAGGVRVLRLHGSVPRYAFYGEPTAVTALRQKLESAGTKPADEDAWALAKIQASEPMVYPETTERFVAPMLGLDELDGIDYKKGCYIGQEVIARAHYRGGVKRHLARAESRTTAPLKPGMDIHALGQDSPAAEVVDARMDAQGVWQMLMVLQDDFRDADLVHAVSGVAVKLVS